MPQRREPAIDRVELRGADGIELLGRSGRFASSDAASYGSVWRDVWVDGLRIVEWTTSPLAGVCAAGVTSPGVVIVAVTKGLLRCHTSAGTVEGVAGAMLVLSAAQRVRFTMPVTTRLLRIEVSGAVAPSQVQRVITAGGGIAEPTRLTASLTSLAEVVLDPVVGGADCPAARAMRALTVAVLDEHAPAAADTDQRAAIVAYIEAHLSDPELSPQTIADAFGISVRWAHHIFNRDHETIARHIRNQRVERVAAQLRADRRFPRISALADRNGFPSRDQLTRAFRAHYGMTLAAYAAAAANGHTSRPSSDRRGTPEDDLQQG